MPNSLTSQIVDTEQHLQTHHREASACTAVLTQKLRRQLADPGNLILAGGIGYILGELTKPRPKSRFTGTVDRSIKAETTPLKTMLGLASSVQTLYAALPIAWMVKSWVFPEAKDKNIQLSQAQAVTGMRRRVTDKFPQ
ncbi:MAG: hypothetical protein ACXWF8_00500 [Methylobacter sp.]